MSFVLKGHRATIPERCFLVGTFSEGPWPSLVIGTQFPKLLTLLRHSSA